MSNEIGRRSVLAVAAATAGVAATSAFTWAPAPASAASAVRPAGAGTTKAGLGAPLDTVMFGDAASEKAHALSGTLSDVVTGALSQPARVFNPQAAPDWWGGSAAFTVKVDPTRTTYLTVKL